VIDTVYLLQLWCNGWRVGRLESEWLFALDILPFMHEFCFSAKVSLFFPIRKSAISPNRAPSLLCTMVGNGGLHYTYIPHELRNSALGEELTGGVYNVLCYSSTIS
jgi:hypothetical protein